MSRKFLSLKFNLRKDGRSVNGIFDKLNKHHAIKRPWLTKSLKFSLLSILCCCQYLFSVRWEWWWHYRISSTPARPFRMATEALSPNATAIKWGRRVFDYNRLSGWRQKGNMVLMPTPPALSAWWRNRVGTASITAPAKRTDNWYSSRVTAIKEWWLDDVAILDIEWTLYGICGNRGRFPAEDSPLLFRNSICSTKMWPTVIRSLTQNLRLNLCGSTWILKNKRMYKIIYGEVVHLAMENSLFIGL